MSPKTQKKFFVQEELEHHILHGLSCEWETATWILDKSHRKLMRKPLFSLRDMKDKLGYWSSERHEICLSKKLVLDHSWDSIREVLLHEMAHQFAVEGFGAHDEPPHGPKFKKACYLLRANPEASGAYMPLDERIFHGSAGPEDRTALRIRKLLALAESRNQHEAEAALAKARELIAGYNIDLLAHDRNRGFVSVFVGRPALRHPREEYHLACLLQDYYFVHGIWVSAYVLNKGKMGRVLELNGTIQNVESAGYVYDFIKHFIDSQWDGYNKNKKLNRFRKTDFAVGIIEGFRSKLEIQKEENKKEDKLGLMKLADPLLKRFTVYRYPHTVSIRKKAASLDEVVLNDGMSIGRNLVIAKGITEKGRRKLLAEGDKKT